MTLGPGLVRVCSAAVDSLPVVGAVVHLMAGQDEIGVAAASDPRAAALGEVAFTTGVGPCFDSFSLRRPVLVPDLSHVGGRWPGYVGALQEDHVGAVFCFPLQLGATGVGVLELYAERPLHLSQPQIALALGFARVAIEYLLGRSEGREEEIGLVDVVGDLVDHRSEIYQAQGVAMVALGVPLSDALLRMRAQAYAQGVPLLDLARQVLTGRVLPEQW